MTDRYTDVSTQGFFSRLGGAFIGLLLGPVFVIAAVLLLSWNEGRAVKASVGLAEAAKIAIEAPTNSVNPTYDGKLVHVTGPATAMSAISDPDVSVNFMGDVAVSRAVEMYQWTEKQESTTQNNTGGSQTTTTTYTYAKDWSPTAINSGNFKHPEDHANPPMPFGAHKFAADGAKLGAYTLDPAMLDLITPPTEVKPDAPAGWKDDNGGLYKGDNPAAPAIGDIRVHYTALNSGSTISVLAQQAHGGFAAFVTPNGYSIRLAQAGNAAAGDMVAEARATESTWTWILRGVGALLMFIGFMLFFGPLATFASVLPFLGSLVRGASAALAFVLTIPLTLVTIAVAWLAFRPLVGGGLLAAAAVIFYLLARWHHGRTKGKMAAQPA